LVLVFVDLTVEIARANVKDAEEILSLQKLAYSQEAKLYDDFQIPPLVESLSQLKANFETHVFLKATVDGRIVGSVRVLQNGDTCEIGRLMVRPDCQNRGIGTKLFLEAERVFPSCRRLELCTGDRSVKNIHIYKKLGYRVFKSEKPERNVNLVFLEKQR
jgi:ribosomal protein S18 acetylase RimI-like enzyme